LKKGSESIPLVTRQRISSLSPKIKGNEDAIVAAAYIEGNAN
jgi:hypothetical protein